MRRPWSIGPRRLRLLLLLCTVSVSFGAKCPFERKPRAKKAVAVKNTLPDSADQVILGFRALLHDQGVSKGLLLSDQATSYEDGSRLELERVNLTFYTSLGDKDGVLTSRSGSYSTRLSRLEARGDVIVKREDGRTLTSPQLVYDQARNQIFSDSSFTFVQPSGQLSGIGFESDPRLTLFKCHRACKGVAPVQIPIR
jgi:LPS export ABC transporter protein LptC